MISYHNKLVDDYQPACTIYDIVARMGGDELAVLVSDIKSLEDLASLASRIVKQFELPFQVSGTDFFVTTSVGVASNPNDDNNAIDLLKYAESAMYVAKKWWK